MFFATLIENMKIFMTKIAIKNLLHDFATMNLIFDR